jgi:hypothetical protein
MLIGSIGVDSTLLAVKSLNIKSLNKLCLFVKMFYITLTMGKDANPTQEQRFLTIVRKVKTIPDMKFLNRKRKKVRWCIFRAQCKSDFQKKHARKNVKREIFILEGEDNFDQVNLREKITMVIKKSST